jgi:diguanylate cyclase (GGDEF)-like protein
MFTMAPKTLDDLLPFAAIIAADGTIAHLGRSLRRVTRDVGGRRFFEMFSVCAPRPLRRCTDPARLCGAKVVLEAAIDIGVDKVRLRASIAPADPSLGTYLVLTSLGAQLHTQLGPLGLNSTDFAHADPSIDMLYVLRTQGTLIDEMQGLADRLRIAKETAEAQAHTDQLTGLPNRRGLSVFAENLLAERERGAVATAWLLHVDLDRFKQVNDTLGHAAGDAILKRVAGDLRAVLLPGDFAARIGGDEFVLVLRDVPDTASAVDRARDVISRVQLPLDFCGQAIQVGASVGVTRVEPASGQSVDGLLLEADLALYEVKRSGRGSVHVYSDTMRAREAVVRELIRDLEPAIARGEFVPYFQLQVDTARRSPLGVEALGRWMHPRHGLISPAQFLYVAERAKLVERIDTAIYAAALDWFARWKHEGIAPPHLSLNVTGAKLIEPGFVPRLRVAVGERGLAPGDIMLELVETVLLDGETDEVRRAAHAAVDAGFALAIDDFGTGHASITSLLSVPIRVVKIDRALVHGIHQDERRRTLTHSILQMCRALDLEVLVEGVEQIEDARAIEAMGCSAFQGFLYSRPLPGAGFAEVLRDAQWTAVASRAPALPARATG